MMQRILTITLLFACLCTPNLGAIEKNTVRDTTVIGKHFKYEGEWPEGKGVLYSYKYGLVFGTFRNGEPYGKCLAYGPGNRKYWGPYTDGKMTGKACVSRKDGAILVRGDFVNGRQHGIDTVYREDGTVIVGRYESNKFVERIAEYNYFIPKDIRKARPKFPKVRLSKQQKEFLKVYDEKYSEHQKKLREERMRQNSGEIKPKFNGSHDGFSKWVNEMLVYPPIAKKAGQKGVTVLQFTITTEGKLVDLKILRSSGYPVLDNEAVRVVSESPDWWTSGTRNGIPENMTLTMPVIFGSKNMRD